MDSERLRKWVKLDKLKKRLEAKLEETKEIMSKLQDPLINAMIEAGIASIKIDQRNVGITSRIWAKILIEIETDEDREKVIQAIKNAGLKNLVKEGYNYLSLSSYISELIKSGEPLPKEFDGIIGSRKEHKLKARKS